MTEPDQTLYVVLNNTAEGTVELIGVFDKERAIHHSSWVHGTPKIVPVTPGQPLRFPELVGYSVKPKTYQMLP